MNHHIKAIEMELTPDTRVSVNEAIQYLRDTAHGAAFIGQNVVAVAIRGDKIPIIEDVKAISNCAYSSSNYNIMGF